MVSLMIAKAAAKVTANAKRHRNIVVIDIYHFTISKTIFI